MTTPRNDAAPLAGGAGVNDPLNPLHCTSVPRLLVRVSVPEASNSEVSVIGCRAADRRAHVLAFIMIQARRDGSGRDEQDRPEIKLPALMPGHGTVSMARSVAPEGSCAALRERLVDSPLECRLAGEPKGGAA